jgi:hypothetical protein
MTADELYEALDKAGIDFEVVEIFEGLRVISIMVDEVSDDDLEEDMTDETEEIENTKERENG